MPVIDSDTHISEPADLWTSRIDTAAAEDLPQVRFNEGKGRHEWYIAGQFVSLAPAGAVAGYKDPPPASPRSFDEAHPAAFDRDARLAVMDEEGVWAQVLYPNVGGFGSGHFLKLEDPGLRIECVRVYNDFLVEWMGDAADRFVAVCAVPFWDLDACVEEIRRAAKLGHKAVLFTGSPDVWWEEPHLADPHWDPVWATAEELGLSISFHAGGGDPSTGWINRGYTGMPARTRFTANSVPMFFGTAGTITDVIFGGIPERFPNLKFVTVESGIGWVPFLLECMDHQFVENRVRESSPELQLMPSEYFHRQMLSTFWFEQAGPRLLLEEIGVENVMFETDFPHPTCLWPPESVRERATRSMEGYSQEVRDRVMWRNAAELYRIPLPGPGETPAGGSDSIAPQSAEQSTTKESER